MLTFLTAIFLKVHAHYRHELVFFLEIFKVKSQCALCNPNYGTSLSRFTKTITNILLPVKMKIKVSYLTSNPPNI